MTILVAEDDARLAAVLAQALAEAGWEVETVGDGRAAFGRALPGGIAYDVLLLDWMLPGMDGVTVCRRLRDAGVSTPVLMLTARSAVRERIAGLDAGADDYLPKPFDVDELLARLRALRRRATIDAQGIVDVDGLVVDPVARRVTRNGTEIGCPRGSSTSFTCWSPGAAGSSPGSRSSTRSGTARPTCAAM